MSAATLPSASVCAGKRDALMAAIVGARRVKSKGQVA